MNDESGGSRRRRGRSPKRGKGNKGPPSSRIKKPPTQTVGSKQSEDHATKDDFVRINSSSVQGLRLFDDKLPLRPPSRSSSGRGRCRSHSPPGRTLSKGGTRQTQYSQEARERERKRISLMLGDEQFPADDVSAFLGDFSLADSIITDFPGVDIKGAATAKPSNPSSAKQKKQNRKAESKANRKKNPDRSDVSIAAMEALEKSAIAPHKGELAKKLHAKKQQLLQQPGSQTTSSTTSEASADTASSKLKSSSSTLKSPPASPWDTQNEPQLSPRRPSAMAKLRSLLTPPTAKKSSAKISFQEMTDHSGSLDLPLETDNVSTVSSKGSSNVKGGVAQKSSSADKNQKKKKKTKAKRKPRKDKEALPTIPSATATKSNANATTRTNETTITTTSPDMSSGQESHTSFSLSLSDLDKSHSTLTSAEITTATTQSASSSISTFHSHNKASKTAHHDSSGSITTSQSSSNYDDDDIMMNGPVSELEDILDQPIHMHSRSTGFSAYGSKSYPTETSILLDSLQLDTVHETNEDAFSEATSRHTINHSSDHDSRRPSFRSLGSAHSIPQPVMEEHSFTADMDGERQEHSDNNAVRAGRRSIVGIDSTEDMEDEHDDIISDEDEASSQRSDVPDKCHLLERQDKSQSQHRPRAEGVGSEIERNMLSTSRDRRGNNNSTQISGKDHGSHCTSRGSRQRNHYKPADRSTSRHNASVRSEFDDYPTSVCFSRDDSSLGEQGSHIQFDSHAYDYRGQPYACYEEPNFRHYSHQDPGADPYGDFHYRRPIRRVDRYHAYYDQAFIVEDPPAGMVGGPPSRRTVPSYPGDRGVHSNKLDRGRRVLPKRRHSIGSGHSRDSILSEICSTRQGDNAKQQMIDISRHHSRRNNQCRHSAPIMAACAPRDLESRLTSSGASSSLFETFGIRYLDEGRRPIPRRRLDDESHSWGRPPPAQPLYHRPDGFDINEYVESSTEPNGGRVSHRGRQMYSSMRKTATDHADGSNQQYGERNVAEKRWAEDDGSLRYPRRFSFGGSFSGRTTLKSWDDSSLHSFAI